MLGWLPWNSNHLRLVPRLARRWFTNSFQLYCTAIGGLVAAALMLFAGWFHYHKRAPKLEWFQNVESMLNHHLAGLLGLGCLSWAGHQITSLCQAIGFQLQRYSLAPRVLNSSLMAELFPSFAKVDTFLDVELGILTLTFKGGLNPVTGSLYNGHSASLKHWLCCSSSLVICKTDNCITMSQGDSREPQRPLHR